MSPILPAVVGRRTSRHGVRAATEEDRPAATTAEGIPKPLQNPSGFGLGGPGTWFGFGKKQEREVGRLAMMGFAVRILRMQQYYLELIHRYGLISLPSLVVQGWSWARVV
jgi:hypothetical protein